MDEVVKNPVKRRPRKVDGIVCVSGYPGLRADADFV